MKFKGFKPVNARANLVCTTNTILGDGISYNNDT